jgi:nitrogen fixation negative regulator NifL
MTRQGNHQAGTSISGIKGPPADDLFRAIVEASPTAILMVNAEGVINLANSRTEELFGYSRAELLGQKIEILVPDRYRARHHEYREGFLQNASARPMGAGRDLYCLRKDGSEVAVEIGLSPINANEETFVLASIIDITERKRGEEESLLQTRALECAANGIVITDRNGKIVWVNRAFSKTTGYAAEEVVGQNPRLLKSGVQGDDFYRDMWTTILSGSIWHGVVINRKKDGSLIHDDMTITPIQNGSQEITHFIAIKQDITERIRDQQALRESEERLQTVIENLAEGLVISELDGQLVQWNRAAVEMHGFTSLEECLVKLPEFERIFELRTPSGEKLSFEDWPLPRIIRGESLRNLELSVRRLDTELDRIFSYGGQIVREPSGKRLAFVTISDVTERRHAERGLAAKSEELSATTQQLWQASKLATMGELAASVAHELNNPLATIALRTELLVTHLPPESSSHASAEVILNEVDRMATLVDNLLQFSRRGHRQVSSVRVTEEISTSVDFIHYYLHNRSVTVERRFGAGLPMIHADRQQLRQVFLNLLTNAADAMSGGGKLILTADKAMIDGQAWVQVQFIDQGVGIAPEHLDRIWESFFTTKPEGKGTGLGLAICRRILEEHGGTIEILSELNSGTTVRVRFPATYEVSPDHD